MASVDINYRIIGLNVSIHRHSLNWTQEQLAEKAGLSKQFVGNIECGRAIPSLKTVLSLCDALNVTPNDLLSLASTHDPNAPCTLREELHVFKESITDQLFPPQLHEIRIDPQDLPLFDIDLTDMQDDSEI